MLWFLFLFSKLVLFKCVHFIIESKPMLQLYLISEKKKKMPKWLERMSSLILHLITHNKDIVEIIDSVKVG